MNPPALAGGVFNKIFIKFNTLNLKIWNKEGADVQSINLSVLIFEDDRPLAELTAKYLCSYGMRAKFVTNFAEFEKIWGKEDFDILLLDIMLGDVDGISLCRHIRSTCSIPIIFITALGEETDIVVGLEVGADDYIVKPFSPRVLLAHIKSIMRRAGEKPEPAEIRAAQSDNIYFDGWILDCRSCMLIDREGRGVSLSYSLYRLLVYFLEHPFELIERERLVRCLKSAENEELLLHRLDAHISRLRACLGDNGKEHKYIKTVRNIGYRFVAENISREEKLS